MARAADSDLLLLSWSLVSLSLSLFFFFPVFRYLYSKMIDRVLACDRTSSTVGPLLLVSAQLSPRFHVFVPSFCLIDE